MKLIDWLIYQENKETNRLLRRVLHRLPNPPPINTPTAITFKEITMLKAAAGNTLVFTGTLTPTGSEFPSGTAFDVVSSDSTVTPTVDSTGLNVIVPLPDGWVEDPNNPLTINYTASGITPYPPTSPTSLSATITPSVPPPPTLTPTGITFQQTT